MELGEERTITVPEILNGNDGTEANNILWTKNCSGKAKITVS
jgi:hypothetical protein